MEAAGDATLFAQGRVRSELEFDRQLLLSPVKDIEGLYRSFDEESLE